MNSTAFFDPSYIVSGLVYIFPYLKVTLGLTVSSVVGTVLANLVGGRLCDMFHPGILILVSFALGFLNSAVFFAERLYHSMEKHG